MNRPCRSSSRTFRTLPLFTCARSNLLHLLTRAMVAGVCRSRRTEARIQQMLWKVDYSDIVFISTVRLCHVFFGPREFLSQSQ